MVNSKFFDESAIIKIFVGCNMTKPQTVPKTANVVTLNDFRSIALTSFIMKCFEKLVKGKVVA